LYSGFFAIAAFLIITLFLNKQKEKSLRHSIPPGYIFSYAGILIFLVAGFLDMFWHIIFGIEVDVEALLSPTHLLLATGGFLIVIGPYMKATKDEEFYTYSWFHKLPAMLSLVYGLLIFSFMTQNIHPLVFVHADGVRPLTDTLIFYKQSLGEAGILLQTACIMTCILSAIVTLKKLPQGLLFILFTLLAVGMSFMKDQFRFIIPSMISGIFAEIIYGYLKPSLTHERSFQLFSFLIPIIFFSFYFLTIGITGHIWWKIHFWAGSIFLSGFVGFLISYVMLTAKKKLS
jgi:hypothetical protein